MLYYRALSHEVTCSFRLYLEMGRTGVQPQFKALTITMESTRLDTGDVWNNLNRQGSMLVVHL